VELRRVGQRRGRGLSAGAIDDETGLADLAAYDPVVLSGLLPYGLPCDGIEDASALAAPKLFSDPQSGFPHLFASDFAECLFYVLQIGHDVIVDPVTERRRHIIISARAAPT
jgi:hypothetical protein